MKILILYFSGTGNTEYISRYIFNYLKNLSSTTELLIRPIESYSSLDFQNIDLLCLGFPIYALRTPKNVMEIVESLPSVDQVGLFLYCTMGFAAGNALKKIYKKLRPKGYLHIANVKILMPGSDGLAMLNNNSKYVKKAVQKDYEHIKKLDFSLEEIKNEIIRWNDSIEKKFYEIRLPLNVIDSLFGWIFSLLYIIFENWMKKKYYADKNCTRCGICIQICPVKNIQFDNRNISFGDQCIVCLRCVHQCPSKAIQIGNFTTGKYRWHGPKGDFNPLKLLKNYKN